MTLLALGLGSVAALNILDSGLRRNDELGESLQFMLKLETIKANFPLSNDILSLCIFKESDISSEYIAWLNDPEIVKYSDQRFKTHSLATSRAYCKKFAKTDGLFIAIKNKENDNLLGTSGVFFDRHHDTADIGMLIGKPYWGQGIGGQAWRLIMNFLLDHANVRKVTGGTLSCNQAMIKVMEKNHMQLDGIRKQQQLVDTVAYDIVHYCRFSV